MKARFIEPVKKELELITLWGECRGGLHRGSAILTQHYIDEDYETPSMASLDESIWSLTCEKCGDKANIDEVNRSMGMRIVYNTDSGKAEPGDLFYRSYGPKKGGCYFHESGCDGVHLYAILPNGATWDIDSRATNCTRKDDSVHRCWIREGVPPNITAGKTGGDTCSAGAGSIQAGGWHGFLRNGEFKKC